MEQLTLDMDFSAPIEENEIPAEEQAAFEIIRASLKEMLKAEGIPEEPLGIKNSRLKDGRPSAYYVVYFYGESFPICRIRLSKEPKTMRVLKKYKNEAAHYAKIKVPKNDNYILVPINDIGDFRAFEPLFKHILDDILDNMPSDFGCCSRYEQCSDTGRCINPMLDLAAQCGYRKNLRRGRIFYGKNKVDLSKVTFAAPATVSDSDT